jgi:hypothetical protein
LRADTPGESGPPTRAHPRRGATAAAVTAALGLALGACGGGGGSSGGGASVAAGTLAERPDGSGPFFVEAHRGGANQLRLIETTWGRLVDVHDVDAGGEANPQPVLRDLVVGENVRSDGVDYRLEVHPVTQATRLVVLRRRGAPDDGRGTFESLVRAATRGLAPVLPRHDDGSAAAPFSLVARNACLVLRFDDVLLDTPAATAELVDAVRVVTGYPPQTPLSPRILFDRNHGAIVGGAFHSTRVLIDATVSPHELGGTGAALPTNQVGLPASAFPGAPNLSIRIPTRTSASTGRFGLLRTLGGAPLSESDNGPLDGAAPTRDVVRAFRSGNGDDPNNGFLLDLDPPEVVGSWSVTLSRARADPRGPEGFAFLVDVAFTSPCQEDLSPGDVLSVGGAFVEVTRTSAPPNSGGVVADVEVRSLAAEPQRSLAALVGDGFLVSTYEPASRVPASCWVSFVPPPGRPPALDVPASAQVHLRFSKPMLPASLAPMEAFAVARGSGSAPPPGAEELVVGTVAGTKDLQVFAFTPLLPLDHVRGTSDTYHVRLGDVVDLSGNALRRTPPSMDFTLDPADATRRSRGVVLRFSDLDEVRPVDPVVGVLDDVRGQVTYDLARGVLRPRGVAFASYAADRTIPVPSIMIPFTPGVQTPLSRLGSKLQALWRHCDLGWTVLDETKHNLDVSGLSWSPVGGVLRDFFEGFEIRLAHSRYLPDEALNIGGTPRLQNTGLPLGPARFADNVLADARSPQTVVHGRSLGYRVDPADQFASASGTRLMPYPLNRSGGPLRTYTWRDTAVHARGGPAGVGVPLDIQSGKPLELAEDHGTIYSAGEVRSIALPLLIEYRCYPSSVGLGLNPLDISLAVNSAPTPHFRAFSTGGVNWKGVPVTIDPDREAAPRGGFNPVSSPTGKPTRSADNSFYVGQLDTVVRISRAHTVWIDTGLAAPVFHEPIVVPDPAEQPPGTRVVVELRGARGFDPAATSGKKPRAFDAASIGPYGFVLDRRTRPATELDVQYVPAGQGPTWSASASVLDGARYFQLRFTFVNDVDAGLAAELSALGVAYE